MTLVQRPNAGVLVDLDEPTTLTYAPRVDRPNFGIITGTTQGVEMSLRPGR